MSKRDYRRPLERGQKHMPLLLNKEIMISRFKNVMPYNYEEVISIKDRAGFIWDLESQLHRLLKRYTYRPQFSFGGETECFSKMPKSVLKKIDEFRNSKQHQLIA